MLAPVICRLSLCRFIAASSPFAHLAASLNAPEFTRPVQPPGPGPLRTLASVGATGASRSGNKKGPGEGLFSRTSLLAATYVVAPPVRVPITRSSRFMLPL